MELNWKNRLRSAYDRKRRDKTHVQGDFDYWPFTPDDYSNACTFQSCVVAEKYNGNHINDIWKLLPTEEFKQIENLGCKFAGAVSVGDVKLAKEIYTKIMKYPTKFNVESGDREAEDA